MPVEAWVTLVSAVVLTGAIGVLARQVWLLRALRGPDLTAAAAHLETAGTRLEAVAEPLAAAVRQLAAAVEPLDTRAAAERIAATVMALGPPSAAVTEAVTRLDASLADAAEAARLGAQGGEAIARAAERLETLGPAIGELLDRLSVSTGELTAILHAMQQSQEPVAQSLQRSSQTLAETSGNFDHLIRELDLNHTSNVERLEQVYTRLDSAAARFEQAAEEWGRLVRSGLASTQEFSRQALEAVLAGLEQTPEQYASVARSAAQAAEATAALQDLPERIVAAGDRLAKLAVAVDEGLRQSLNANLQPLAEQVAQLRAAIAGTRR